MAYNQKSDEQIAVERRQERRQYHLMAALNIFFLLGFFTFLVWAIVDVFLASWAHAAGFGILTFIFGFIFRLIPIPETKLEKLTRELRSYRR